MDPEDDLIFMGVRKTHALLNPNKENASNYYPSERSQSLPRKLLPPNYSQNQPESRQNQEKRGNNQDEGQRDKRAIKPHTYEESLRDYQGNYEVVESRRERQDYHSHYDQRYSYHQERNYPQYPLNYYPVQ